MQDAGDGQARRGPSPERDLTMEPENATGAGKRGRQCQIAILARVKSEPMRRRFGAGRRVAL